MPNGDPKKNGSITPMRERYSQLPSKTATTANWVIRTCNKYLAWRSRASLDSVARSVPAGAVSTTEGVDAALMLLLPGRLGPSGHKRVQLPHAAPAKFDGRVQESAAQNGYPAPGHAGAADQCQRLPSPCPAPPSSPPPCQQGRWLLQDHG